MTINANSNWTWIGGSSLPDDYFTWLQGQTPGIRSGHGMVLDAKLNRLYVIGGGFEITSETESEEYFLNDVWQLDLNSQLWTWISGTFENINAPGILDGENASPAARQYFACGLDSSSGLIYIHGGKGYGNSTSLGLLNDLWQFNPTSGKWTWLSGSFDINQNNVYADKVIESTKAIPGSRYMHSLVVIPEDGRLILFGGFTDIFLSFNDLWRWNPVKKLWTWLNGGGNLNYKASYGEMGVSSPYNLPRARGGFAMTYNPTRKKIIIFGGSQYPLDFFTVMSTCLNDLWEYDLQSNTWTWIGGTGRENAYASSMRTGIATKHNMIDCRLGSQMTVNNQTGTLLIYGGSFYPGEFFGGTGQSVWLWDPITKFWTQISDPEIEPAHNQLGVSSQKNQPGLRNFASMCSHPETGAVYVYGGLLTENYIGDLWVLKPTAFVCPNDTKQIGDSCVPYSELPMTSDPPRPVSTSATSLSSALPSHSAHTSSYTIFSSPSAQISSYAPDLNPESTFSPPVIPSTSNLPTSPTALTPSTFPFSEWLLPAIIVVVGLQFITFFGMVFLWFRISQLRAKAAMNGQSYVAATSTDTNNSFTTNWTVQASSINSTVDNRKFIQTKDSRYMNVSDIKESQKPRY